APAPLDHQAWYGEGAAQFKRRIHQQAAQVNTPCFSAPAPTTPLDALRNGDTNGNDLIELSELVAHVQGVVPRMAEKMGGTGRATTAEPLSDRQTARFGSRGEDFAVARRPQ